MISNIFWDIIRLKITFLKFKIFKGNKNIFTQIENNHIYVYPKETSNMVHGILVVPKQMSRYTPAL